VIIFNIRTVRRQCSSLFDVRKFDLNSNIQTRSTPRLGKLFFSFATFCKQWKISIVPSFLVLLTDYRSKSLVISTILLLLDANDTSCHCSCVWLFQNSAPCAVTRVVATTTERIHALTWNNEQTKMHAQKQKRRRERSNIAKPCRWSNGTNITF